jgi:hypothetical protein
MEKPDKLPYVHVWNVWCNPFVQWVYPNKNSYLKKINRKKDSPSLTQPIVENIKREKITQLIFENSFLISII